MGKRNRRRNNRSSRQANARPRSPVPDLSADDYSGWYPSGCLHTLMEEERDSPEMNHYIHFLEQFALFVMSRQDSNDYCYFELLGNFWDRPDNKAFVDHNLMRFMVFQVIKIVKKKDCYGPNWKTGAAARLCDVVDYAGVIKFGTFRAYRAARNQQLRGVQVNEHQARFIFALDVIKNLIESHAGLLHVLDQFSPCNCLKREIHQEEQDLVQQGKDEGRFVCCVCGKREVGPRTYKMCRPCGMRCYCSHECHVADWRQEGDDGMKHKDISPLTKEILSFQIEPMHESVE